MLARPQHRRQMSLTWKMCVCLGVCVCDVNSYTYSLTPKSRIHLLASVENILEGGAAWDTGRVWSWRRKRRRRRWVRWVWGMFCDCCWAAASHIGSWLQMGVMFTMLSADPCQQQPQQQQQQEQEQEQDNLLCCFWYGKNFLMMLQKSFALAPFAPPVPPTSLTPSLPARP